MRGAALAAVLVLAAAQEKKAADDVDLEKGVVYGKAGGVELTLDLARPKKAEGARPCVLVIHGGGWQAGDRTQHDDLAVTFARRGYVAASVGYRLAPAFLLPAAIEDVKCAVRFLRANAETYGIDPKRFGAVGFSAGAHLSMMLGVMGKDDGLEGDGGHPDQPSQVQAVVSFFGPTDLGAKDIPELAKPILAKAMGGPADEKADLCRKASPLTYVSKGDAPMVLFQGTKDPLVPPTQAYAMLDAMTKAGVPGRAEIIAGAGHGWLGPDLARTEAETYAFFDETLKKK